MRYRSGGQASSKSHADAAPPGPPRRQPWPVPKIVLGKRPAADESPETLSLAEAGLVSSAGSATGAAKATDGRLAQVSMPVARPALDDLRGVVPLPECLVHRHSSAAAPDEELQRLVAIWPRLPRKAQETILAVARQPSVP